MAIPSRSCLLGGKYQQAGEKITISYSVTAMDSAIEINRGKVRWYFVLWLITNRCGWTWTCITVREIWLHPSHYTRLSLGCTWYPAPTRHQIDLVIGLADEMADDLADEMADDLVNDVADDLDASVPHLLQEGACNRLTQNPPSRSPTSPSSAFSPSGIICRSSSAAWSTAGNMWSSCTRRESPAWRTQTRRRWRRPGTSGRRACCIAEAPRSRPEGEGGGSGKENDV